MKLWKSLQNPFLLVGQGFVVGAILFYATTPETSEARAAPAEARASATAAGVTR